MDTGDAIGPIAVTRRVAGLHGPRKVNDHGDTAPTIPIR